MTLEQKPPRENEITREEIHQRNIDIRAYRRSGLTDRKPWHFVPPAGKKSFPAQSPIHNLGVTLAFDSDMVVREVVTFMDSYPYEECSGGGDALRALVGLQIGTGWNRSIRERLPACDTCMHLKELLGPIATAAIQAMVGIRPSTLDSRDSAGKPLKVDSCYAYSAARTRAQTLWPQYCSPGSADRAD
jgi:hypothetical protein